MNRKKVIQQNYFKLFGISLIVGLLSSLLALALRYITEKTEHHVFSFISNTNPLLFIIFPTIGITIIYFLRKFVFKGRKNKGITEIYKTLDLRKDHLPLFKIPSHFINGFLTVIFGGSSGIEVSTVVSTATIGNEIYKKNYSAKLYKRELICAASAAGVAILFSSPLAGLLFGIEVISRKFKKTILISCMGSTLVAAFFLYILGNEPIIPQELTDWQWKSVPFFILLSFFAGLFAVGFTLLVIHTKSFFGNINNNFIRVNLGAISVGLLIYYFPVLFGDSYHGLNEILSSESNSIWYLLLLIFLKPLASSLTLGAGGDGGVFAPSIIAGAFMGLTMAIFCKTVLHMDINPINFALIGAGSALSAAIYAPLTSIILICNIAPNGYILIIPLLVCCFISKFFANKLLPYNVYTYDMYKDNLNKSSI
ncbi:chloride channel protein [Sphingobacterium endophyticum]|uniref:chloride channel protein n=1 Tax=Sphingobacterium endophyticum TaxID=2546448 RepID=UPI0012E2DF52|nr:chloride channel protein [Sphingobacterium endophyticum]